MHRLQPRTMHYGKWCSSTIQLLNQTDICWDQLLLVPAACDLKPLLLMCRGLTRSSGSIHLLLIPCRHQSPNADTHTVLARTYKLSVAPAVQTVHRCCLLGLSERNDYHTSVSTCHWALPVSAMSLSHAETLTYTDSSIGCFMLMQIVGGCLVCGFVCSSIRSMCVLYVNSWYISVSLLNHSLSPYLLWHSRNSKVWTVFCPPQRVVTPTRGRCCPSSALPQGSVFLEWHVWLSTAATSEWCQPAPH